MLLHIWLYTDMNLAFHEWLWPRFWCWTPGNTWWRSSFTSLLIITWTLTSNSYFLSCFRHLFSETPTCTLWVFLVKIHCKVMWHLGMKGDTGTQFDLRNHREFFTFIFSFSSSSAVIWQLTDPHPPMGDTEVSVSLVTNAVFMSCCQLWACEVFLMTSQICSVMLKCTEQVGIKDQWVHDVSVSITECCSQMFNNLVLCDFYLL